MCGSTRLYCFFFLQQARVDDMILVAPRLQFGANTTLCRPLTVEPLF